MKKNMKGFMLVETLVVTVFVLGMLIFLYAQFTTIKKSYDRSFTYNTVEGLYAANNVVQFLTNDNFYEFAYALSFSGQYFIPFYDSDSAISGSCNTNYVSAVNYCQSLMDNLNIKSVIFTKENLKNLNNKINEWHSNKEKPKELSNNMIDFIKTIKYEGLSDIYRLIVEYDDGTFATVLTDGIYIDVAGVVPVSINLKGDNYLYSILGFSFNDPGYEVEYSNGIMVDNNDLSSDLVTVTGTVGNTLNQEYTLTYTLKNEGQIIDSVSRIVKVINSEYTFDYTGGEQTLPIYVSGKYKLEVWGASGGNCKNSTGVIREGGKGGYSIGNIVLTKNQNLYINIGGVGENNFVDSGTTIGGYNGGGNGHGYASGGGATHIATSSGVLSNLSSKKDDILIVAGGGGGASGHAGGGGYCLGGHGGGISGINGVTGSTSAANCGIGGNQYSGNLFGAGYSANKDYISGGGGGYYGGGAGTASSSWDACAGGGSGNISSQNLFESYMYCYNCTTSTEVTTKTYTTTNVSSTPIADYAKSGNGYAKITYISPMDFYFLDELKNEGYDPSDANVETVNVYRNIFEGTIDSQLESSTYSCGDRAVCPYSSCTTPITFNETYIKSTSGSCNFYNIWASISTTVTCNVQGYSTTNNAWVNLATSSGTRASGSAVTLYPSSNNTAYPTHKFTQLRTCWSMNDQNQLVISGTGISYVTYPYYDNWKLCNYNCSPSDTIQVDTAYRIVN